MSVHLIGVTAMGGVPLFARHTSKKKQTIPSEATGTTSPSSSTSPSFTPEEIPFATLAALNGVNLFCRLNDADLLSCVTKDSKIRWKMYKGSIVLIVIVSHVPHVTHTQLLHFLDIVFDCLILICGLSEITSQNIEKLKKCLRPSYQLLDHLITCLSSSHTQRLALLTDCIEYQLNVAMDDFTTSLVESVAQFASSSFCVLFINHKLYSASKQWWSRLSGSKDALLISLLVNSLATNDLSQCKEFHVFLPDNCPNALTRLIVCHLYPKVTLCLLCTENPKLEVIEKEIIMQLRDSKMHQDKFAKLVNNNVSDKEDADSETTSIKIDDKVISYVIIRDDFRLFSVSDGLEENRLMDIMKLTQPPNIESDENTHFESYLFSEKFKCFHIQHDHFRMYAIFANHVNLSQMKITANKTLNSLIRDKHIWP